MLSEKSQARDPRRSPIELYLCTISRGHAYHEQQHEAGRTSHNASVHQAVEVAQRNTHGRSRLLDGQGQYGEVSMLLTVEPLHEQPARPQNPREVKLRKIRRRALLL